MQYGWIWADEESMSSPMDFAGGDENDEEEWDEDEDWDGDEDDLDAERDDEDEEDDDEWEEWEDEFDEDDDDSVVRKRSGRPDWS